MLNINLDSIFFENSFLINLAVFFVIITYVLKNLNFQNLLYGFIIYGVFHNFYAIFSYFHSNPREIVVDTFVYGSKNTGFKFLDSLSSNNIRQILILFFVLILNIYFLYSIKFSNLRKIFRENLIIIFLFVLWLITSFEMVYPKNNPYIYKHWLVKFLMIDIFLITYLSLKFNINNSSSVKSWYLAFPIFAYLHITVFLLTIFEFFISNQIVPASTQCVSYADVDCVLRPSGTFFNPNTLGIYYCFSNIILTAYILNKGKLNVFEIFLIMTTSIGLFFTASRSGIIMLLTFQILLIFFQIIRSKDKIINTLKVYSIYFSTLIFVAAFTQLNLFYGKFNVFFNLMSNRFLEFPSLFLRILYSKIYHLINDTLILLTKVINDVTIKLHWMYVKLGGAPLQIKEYQIKKIPELMTKPQSISNIASYKDRFSPGSTDNTYIITLNNEGTTSFIILCGICFFYLLKSFQFINYNKKDVNSYIIISALFTMCCAFFLLNIFANFPLYIFVSIFLAILLFIYTKSNKGLFRG